MSTPPIRNARAASLPAKLSRTWLLVNAVKPQLFEPAQRSEADSVIFDMEAAVPDEAKDEARDNVVKALSELDPDSGEPQMTAWVRINDVKSKYWEDDLAALNGLPGLRGLMLPNTEAPEQVTWTAMRGGAGVPVLALIETAIGVENATEIARAPGTFRLALGTNDLRKDTGMSDDPLALAYVRSRLVIASRVGGLPGAIDGPSGLGATDQQLREDCAWTIRMGMAGKLTLWPRPRTSSAGPASCSWTRRRARRSPTAPTCRDWRAPGRSRSSPRRTVSGTREGGAPGAAWPLTAPGCGVGRLRHSRVRSSARGAAGRGACGTVGCTRHRAALRRRCSASKRSRNARMCVDLVTRR
jgi:citrate lyase subunit beta/citryl-CoA lyase